MEGDLISWNALHSPMGSGQCQELKVVNAVELTPAQDGRPITPVIIKHGSVERVGPKPAEVPEGN